MGADNTFSLEEQKRMDFNWRAALKHATICMTELWLDFPDVNNKRTVRELYVHTYDLEVEITNKYGQDHRTIDKELESRYGTDILSKIMTPDDQ